MAQLVKNPAASVGATRDTSLIFESARSPGVGNGNPLQYSCLENFMDRGAWWATYSPWVVKTQTQLSTHTHTRLNEINFLRKSKFPFYL